MKEKNTAKLVYRGEECQIEMLKGSGHLLDDKNGRMDFVEKQKLTSNLKDLW